MSDDKRLKQAVLDELLWEPSVNAAHIGVTAKDGVVTLMGHVESFVEKSAAEKAARRIKGVKAVAEEIEVRLPFNVKRGDEEIASAVVNRLSWDSTSERRREGEGRKGLGHSDRRSRLALSARSRG